MDEHIKDVLIPRALAERIEKETYRLWREKAPIEEAEKAAVRLFIEYWKYKYVDKNGG